MTHPIEATSDRFQRAIDTRTLKQVYRDRYEVKVQGDDRDGHWFQIVEKDTRIVRDTNCYYASYKAAETASKQALGRIVKKHMSGDKV